MMVGEWVRIEIVAIIARHSYILILHFKEHKIADMTESYLCPCAKRIFKDFIATHHRSNKGKPKKL